MVQVQVGDFQVRYAFGVWGLGLRGFGCEHGSFLKLGYPNIDFKMPSCFGIGTPKKVARMLGNPSSCQGLV